MRIFLTGGTGVLGRRLVPMLLDNDHEVTAVARSDASAAALRAAGATPVACSVFDLDATTRAMQGHDAVVNVATKIPKGADAMIKRGWRANDRLRRDGSATLTQAAADAGVGRFVQESITFPYPDCGAAWIDEATDRSYFWADATVADAEASAASFAGSHGVGVTLRFAMFWADDSAHISTFVSGARRGRWLLFGDDDAFVSFIHIDDAVGAVLAALTAPSGVYNVSEADPLPRGEHREALAASVGRTTLKPLPRLVERMSGPSGENLACSQRVSSAALTDATGWAASHAVVDAWGAAHVS